MEMMKEILKAMREEKRISLDAYTKGSNLAMWAVLEKSEILVVCENKELKGYMITSDEQGDKLQDELLEKGYKPVKIDNKLIAKMQKLQKEMLKKALGF